MAIKDTQKNIVQEKIIREELMKGEFPSVSLIEDKVNQYFSQRRPGTPRFEHRPMVKGQVSSSTDYNNMFGEIHEDLHTGFEETKYLNNQMMALTDYYENNRIKVERDLKRLEMKADAIASMSESKGSAELISDVFHDFKTLDFSGDAERNIPATNTHVNLIHHTAELDRIRNKTIKHDLSEADVKFKSITTDATVLHLASISNAFQDVISENWRSVVISKTQNGVIAELTIDLVEPVYATNISVTSMTGKPANITAFISSDGSSYQEFEKRKIVSAYQWNFDRQLVSHVRLQMEKTEEDSMNGTDYEYLFGAKTIELREEVFMNEAYLVSKPYALTRTAISSIQLDAEDFVPPNTRILYYIGLDYDTNRIEWQEIRKNTPLDLGMTAQYENSIDMSSKSYGEFAYTQFGNSFYKIASLPYKPIKGSTQLMLGRYMWMKETLTPSSSITAEILHNASMSDWVRAGTTRKSYLSVDQNSDTLTKGMSHRYTSYIYLDEDVTYTGKINTTDRATRSVYLNNGQVKEVGGRYQLQLTKGWNKIQILAYASDTSQEIMIEFFLREVTDQIYAYQDPLEEVSLYDLLHNTSSRIHSRFAIDENQNIIVNYNPREMDITKNGVEYYISYKYQTQAETEHAIRFMALLSKDSQDISSSPRLVNYKLKIE